MEVGGEGGGAERGGGWDLLLEPVVSRTAPVTAKMPDWAVAVVETRMDTYI